jgi:hypothetical protein
MREKPMARLVRRADADRSFDVEYRQRQGDAAIAAAAWELIVTSAAQRGSVRFNSDYTNPLRLFDEGGVRCLVAGGTR